MSILEIIKLEDTNKKGIILHREGLFWRAYEQSAYRFFRYIKPYKATKKLFKGAKKEMVYLGFPHNKLEDIINYQNGNKQINKAEKVIEMAEFETGYNEFIEWKNGLDVFISEHGAANEKKGSNYKIPDLIEKLKMFPIINKTPLECQIFLTEIQNKINGNV